jgi:hypothetical protein
MSGNLFASNGLTNPLAAAGKAIAGGVQAVAGAVGLGGPQPVAVVQPVAVAPQPGQPALPATALGYTLAAIPTVIQQYIPSALFPIVIARNSIVATLFYSSLIVFIIFLIFVFIHFTMFPIFSMSPNDSGFIPLPTVSDRQIAFTKGPAASDLSANFINVPACTYSFGMDIYLSGNFQASNVPRVLLYRSVGTKVAPPSTDLSSNLVSRFPDTNILIWLDPMKNDLYASVVTSTDGTATTARLQTSVPIENVPIRKVFRLTVVFTQQFIELYINGNLEKSMALKSPPLTAANNSYFFPVISTIGPNAMISNLAFWPRVITSREARAYGLPISNENFFSKTST